MDNREKREKAEKTTNQIIGFLGYACYLYFLTHPEKSEEIKEWLQEKWDNVKNGVKQSLDYWESVLTFSRRVEDIRSLPETESEES